MEGTGGAGDAERLVLIHLLEAEDFRWPHLTAEESYIGHVCVERAHGLRGALQRIVELYFGVVFVEALFPNGFELRHEVIAPYSDGARHRRPGDVVRLLRRIIWKLCAVFIRAGRNALRMQHGCENGG